MNAAPKSDADQPMVFDIRIKGHLGHLWAGWFDGLTITLENNGNTLLTGPVIDQAALHGILKKVRDLGIPLLSVNPVEPDPSAGTKAVRRYTHTVYRLEENQ